jgi:hypothetical protein
MARPAYGGRPTCEERRRIDVRVWHRQGRLKAGKFFVSAWACGGEPCGRVLARSEADVVLLVALQREIQGKPRPFSQRVPITWTACHLGGKRPWFLCGGVTKGRACGRRAAVLYDRGETFACRRCCGLAHASQQESPLDRSIRRSRKFRIRLGGDPSIFEPLPPRPRGMHAATYLRLLAQAERADASWLAFMEKRFGGLRGVPIQTRSALAWRGQG